MSVFLSFFIYSIPTVTNGDIAIYATEIYQKDPSGTTQRLIFSRFDAAELDTLFVPGTLVDTYFALDPYDYQQNAGIKLVAKKLIIHGKWWDSEDLWFPQKEGQLPCKIVPQDIIYAGVCFSHSYGWDGKHMDAVDDWYFIK